MRGKFHQEFKHWNMHDELIESLIDGLRKAGLSQRSGLMRGWLSSSGLMRGCFQGKLRELGSVSIME